MTERPEDTRTDAGVSAEADAARETGADEARSDSEEKTSGDSSPGIRIRKKSGREIRDKIKELKIKETAGAQRAGRGSAAALADDRAKSLYSNIRRRRRTPRRRRFLKGLLIYAAAFILVSAACCAVWGKVVRRIGDADPGNYAGNLLYNTDASGWRRLLRTYYPGSCRDYEEGSRVADEVLSGLLDVGKVTWLENSSFSYSGDRGGFGIQGSPTLPSSLPDRIRTRGYDVFSDGKLFACLVIYSSGDGFLPFLNGWNIWNILFSTDFIFGESGVPGFPETSVFIPAGATLTLNGVSGPEPDGRDSDAVYFASSQGETEPPACERLVFGRIYFPPELSAELDGEALELVRDDDAREYRFRYPDSRTHSITVTVPEGVTVTVGGAELTEEWAGRTTAEGELGELDDGGTGTKPTLSVWKVSGLFGKESVSAEIYGKQLELLSSDGGNYIFKTPPECKYTVTVTAPAGSSVTVNGRPAGDGGAPVKADPAEIAGGGTVLGMYDVYELGSIPQALPDVDRYVLTGYLALPRVTAELNGTELEPASVRVSAYDVRIEFDFLPEAETGWDPARTADASGFFADYIRYICGGGAWENPENAETFNSNYESILSGMIEGTAGYVGVMESYRDVFMMKHWDGYTLGELSFENYIRYTDGCVSCRLTAPLKTVRQTGPDDQGNYATETGESTVVMNILQVLYGGEWRVWGFTFEQIPAQS